MVELQRIGADAAIYLIFRIREEISTGAPVHRAIRTSLRTSGKAIFFVSSAVALGYLVLVGSGFRPWVHLGGQEVLFSEGSPGDGLFLIVSGRLQAFQTAAAGDCRWIRGPAQDRESRANPEVRGSVGRIYSEFARSYGVDADPVGGEGAQQDADFVLAIRSPSCDATVQGRTIFEIKRGGTVLSYATDRRGVER